MTIRRPSRGGFTLLELILVMLVIFVLAAVVAPRLTDAFPAAQVRKTADHLLAWMRKARSDAALSGARQRVVIDPKARKFWLEYEPRPLKEPGKFEVLRGAWDEEEFPLAVTVDPGDLPQVKGDSARRYVEFRPDGTSTEAEITISHEGGERRLLRVEPATGDVTLEDPEAPKP